MKRALFSFFCVALLAGAVPAFAKKKAAAQQSTPLITAVFPAGGQRGQTVEVVVSGANLVSGVGSEMADTTVYLTGKGLTARLIIPPATPQPTPSPKPAAVPQPTPSPKPAASPQPTPSPKPAASPQPNASPKPAASPQPTASPKPAASPQPTASPKPAASPQPNSSPKPTPSPTPKPVPLPTSVRLSITIAPDAELGEHDLRLITPAGVSNRVRFIVGALPEINEVEPNSDLSHAQRLPALPVLVNGRIDQSDRDYFRFEAKAGQTIVCEVQARALVPFIADAVPGWFDPMLTLFDPNGKVLQTVDDFRSNPDPVLIFTAPKDGEYLLGLWDVLYRGRIDFVYRLSIGARPYLTYVYPLGGKRGSTVPLGLHGANLPENTLPYQFGDDPDPRRSLTVSNNGLVSNRLPLAVGDLPEITEVEPNDSQAQAQRVTLPVTINGRIQKRGDDDWFVFTAKAGDKLVMDVMARRLGSPLDSILTLFNAKGGELAENDDTVDPSEALLTHHADSRLTYTVPAPDDYYLRIRDTQQKGGDEYAYRLTIAPPQPDVTLRVVTPEIPVGGQGDNATLTVEALRTGGFTGEIPLTVEGLPPGCVVSGTSIQANQDDVVLTISIPPDAPLGLCTPAISGTATIDGKSVVRRAIAAEPTLQAYFIWHTVPIKELLLSITEPPPFSISTSVEPGKVLELRQGSELQIPVKVVRHGDTKGGISVNLQAPPVTKGSASQKPVAANVASRIPFIPPDKDETIITLSTIKQTPLGLRNMVVLGTMKVGKTNWMSVAPAIPIKIVAGDK